MLLWKPCGVNKAAYLCSVVPSPAQTVQSCGFQFSPRAHRVNNNLSDFLKFRIMSENVCRINKFGYCQHGEKCRYKHVDEICQKINCSVHKCDIRENLGGVNLKNIVNKVARRCATTININLPLS